MLIEFGAAIEKSVAFLEGSQALPVCPLLRIALKTKVGRSIDGLALPEEDRTTRSEICASATEV